MRVIDRMFEVKAFLSAQHNAYHCAQAVSDVVNFHNSNKLFCSMVYFLKAHFLSGHKKLCSALASVAQWIEYWPANQRPLVRLPFRAHAWVAGRVPGGGAHERQSHIDISLPLPPSLPLCLKINK